MFRPIATGPALSSEYSLWLTDALIGAADGGLPQRFIWMPTGDPGAPDERPSNPGYWEVVTSGWPRRNSSHLRLVAGQADLVVPESARTAMTHTAWPSCGRINESTRSTADALLCRLKVAVALMALDGRRVIDEADWRLARDVMDVSAFAREQCRRALTEHSRSQNTARALAAAERDEVVAERKSQRARDAILRKLSGTQQRTSGELRRSLKVDIRDYYDVALTELLDRGEIVVSTGTRGNKKVHVYHRYTPPEQPTSSANDRVPPVHGYRRRCPMTRQIVSTTEAALKADIAARSKEAKPPRDCASSREGRRLDAMCSRCCRTGQDGHADGEPSSRGYRSRHNRWRHTRTRARPCGGRRNRMR